MQCGWLLDRISRSLAVGRIALDRGMKSIVLNGKKIIVVMPAYNAAKTLRQTYDEIPHEIVDEVILVDDDSADATVALAKEMGLKVFLHRKNMGYGRNQ